mmetsp:Transcript_140340/g.198925  ORF Transcript_140340/g.198925 Transcript_140340/m.198925 type:complete len:276 (-) Transcript_140340:120-947(-)
MFKTFCAVLVIASLATTDAFGRRRRRSPPPPPPPPITIGGHLVCGSDISDSTTNARNSVVLSLYDSSQPDVWYTFTAPEDGFYYFSTCGSPSDTRLGIMERTQCSENRKGFLQIVEREEGESGQCTTDDHEYAVHLNENEEVFAVVEAEGEFNLNVVCISTASGKCGKKNKKVKTADHPCERDGVLPPVGKGGKAKANKAVAVTSPIASGSAASSTTTPTIVAVAVGATLVVVLAAFTVHRRRRMAAPAIENDVEENVVVVEESAAATSVKQTEI